MSKFKLYDCDIGIKVDGVRYDFSDINSIEIEDPEMNSLTRGANGKNTQGIPYKEGVRDPKVWTVPIMDMSIELKAVLDAAFKDVSRMDVYCISRSDGSSKMLKSAILRQKPQQLTVDETPDSLAVQLIFASYQSEEVFKS